jgi:putative peptidoglycan lipid II flippase
MGVEMAKSLIKSTTIFSGATFVSRLMGFLRDMIVAHMFGATGLTDAFFVAFKIPNFMRRLFAEGAFSQAFVPILAEYKERHHDAMQDFVNKTSGTLGGVVLLVTVVGMVAAPWVIRIFAPGFNEDATRFQLSIDMLRITFPYILFISITAFATGVLNTHNYFAGPAFTPVLLNLAMIAAVIWLAPLMSDPIVALAWGVFAGGVVQLLFQIPFLSHIKILPRFKWAWRDPGVQRVLKLMLPALFGVSVGQIGLLVDTVFASFLPAGSISWLYNSERLMLFPLGMFGVAIATVVLPHLSKRYANQSHAQYSNTIDWAIRIVLLLGLPAAVGLIMLSAPLLSTLFHYGKFDNYDVIMSQRSLVAYSIGVPFMMLVKVLASGFYGQQNIKTPVKIAAIALLVNIVLNFLLISSLKHAGLALASALAAGVNALLLLVFLIRANIFKFHKGWVWYFLRLIIANATMAVFLYYLTAATSLWLSSAWQWRAVNLLGLVLGAVIVYVIMLFILGIRWQYIKGKAL